MGRGTVNCCYCVNYTSAWTLNCLVSPVRQEDGKGWQGLARGLWCRHPISQRKPWRVAMWPLFTVLLCLPFWASSQVGQLQPLKQRMEMGYQVNAEGVCELPFYPKVLGISDIDGALSPGSSLTEQPQRPLQSISLSSWEVQCLGLVNRVSRGQELESTCTSC